MKKLLLMAIIAAIAALVWNRQSTRLHAIQIQNQRLAAAVAELDTHVRRVDSACKAAEQKMVELRTNLQRRDGAAVSAASQQPEAAAATPEPDPARHGGWPQSANFFYLPKENLTNASYKLFDGRQLTDEAACLFGMSPAEREATDKIFDDLIDQFRRAEISHMVPVDPPSGWLVTGGSQPPGSASQFDSALTYSIADLTEDISAARSGFFDQLQQALGASRAEMISSAASSYLAENLDELGGTGERIVGFLWEPESDGTHSLWYGAAGSGYGAGSFQRVMPDVDPNSQIAYYARLFGVNLPGQ